MIVCITGCPATGKTTLAKVLKKELGYEYVDVKRLIKESKLYDSYDNERKCYVVDTKKLNSFLVKRVINRNEDFIIDSLLSHYLPKKYVDLCVVTKCELKELKKRLKKRGYPKEKVRENLDAEIFDVCLNEAKENRHNTFVIYSTKGFKKEAVSQLVGEIDAIKSTGRRAK